METTLAKTWPYLMALIPAFLGAYAGVGLNRLCFPS